MATESGIKSFMDIPGFFPWVDRHVFAALLKSQADSPLGELVELGTYQGKSSVIIGDFVRPGERFVAVDLFGREDLLPGNDVGLANRRENRAQYTNLDRKQFEDNYLALHDTLPEIVEGLTSEILQHVKPGTARFIHVDAGHLYEQVHEDVVNAKKLLRPGGIIAFDDYRTLHTPGVSAAIWQAVFQDGLIPVALTPQKFYGIYDDDPGPYQEVLRSFVNDDRHKRWWMQEQHILGRPVLRIKPTPKKETPKPKPVAKPAAAPKRPAATPTASLTPARRVARKIARDYAPPALIRWAVARRKATKSR